MKHMKLAAALTVVVALGMAGSVFAQDKDAKPEAAKPEGATPEKVEAKKPEAEKSVFEMPTDEEILVVAEDPTKISFLIEDATDNQIIDIVLAVISKIEGLDLNLVDMRNRVSLLLAETSKARGQYGPALINRIIKKVNPRLLPPIFRGGHASAPVYRGQEARRKRAGL